MAQHFLYSAKARSLSLAQIFRLSDDDAYAMLRGFRWEGGKPVCPHCGHTEAYDIATRRIFKCKAKPCRRQFSVTSGTIFASRKLAIRDYLAAIAIFVNGAKGVSALQLGRDLNVSYKTAFVLAHKLREAMASSQDGVYLSGVVEVDGSYYGGYIRPANHKKDRVDQRYAANRPVRKSVIVARERGGRTLTDVFPNETSATPFLRARIDEGATVHTDMAQTWDRLRDNFRLRQVNHTLSYSANGACTNQAESFFSRLRRAEFGTHHYISGPYLNRYAAEMAWREDNRREDNGGQFSRVASLAIAAKKSATFSGYWQRAA